MAKVIVIISGGMDSATMLYWYKTKGFQIKAISFDYGQRHSKELTYAQMLTQAEGIEHKIITLNLGDILKGSSQTDVSVDVPEGHYADENMKKTVVPNRNMVMLAIAGAWAVSEKADVLAYGAHAGDHTIYPDCRASFVDPMAEAFKNCDWHHVQLEAPFLMMTKGDIAIEGTKMGVPYHMTWTCYKGLDKHCGKCGACQERKEAFAFARVSDPTDYEGESYVDTQKTVSL